MWPGGAAAPPPPATATPAAPSSPSSTPATKTAPAVPADPAAAAAERQKVADELKKKLGQQKQKVDSLNHELDLCQPEYRLRASPMYCYPATLPRTHAH